MDPYSSFAITSAAVPWYPCQGFFYPLQLTHIRNACIMIHLALVSRIILWSHVKDHIVVTSSSSLATHHGSPQTPQCGLPHHRSSYYSLRFLSPSSASCRGTSHSTYCKSRADICFQIIAHLPPHFIHTVSLFSREWAIPDDGSLDISDTVMLEYDSPLGIASAVEDGSLPSASPHTLGAVSIEYDSPLGFP